MPQKKQKPKRNNKNWVQLSQHFVKQWPEVLEGIELTKMPVDYVNKVHLYLKNNITVTIDVQKTLQKASQTHTAAMLKRYITKHYKTIKFVDLEFNVTKIKKDVQGKTNKILSKSLK